MPRRLFQLTVSLLFLLIALPCHSSTSDHAVALVYHHVSTTMPTATSVTPRQFEAHLAFLQRNNINVWPLGKIVENLRKGLPVPGNTVAITFDDASVTVFTEVLPRMKRLGWPFTVFVNTEAVDRGFGNSMSWAQLQQVVEAGNEIGNHSHSHLHMIRMLDGERATEWRQRVKQDIHRAQSLITTNTGKTPTLFAYPYGEHSGSLREIIASSGMIGVAQQSGAIGFLSDFQALPRFPMASGHASLSRIATAVRSRPLPVTVTEMPDLDDYQRAPDYLTLTLQESNYELSRLACYSARGDRLPVGQTTAGNIQVMIDLKGQTRTGRNKVNCTAPALDEPGAYYWYSYLWLYKQADGNWYRE